MKKAQVEFIVILGLLTVVVVAVFYAYQSGMLAPSPVPMGIEEQKKMVESSVKSLIISGVHETLKNMSLYGGYLDADQFMLGSVILNGKEVPYWQYNGQIKYPDIHSNFIQGVTNYIKNNKDNLASAFKGKNVSIGNPIISANILNDKIVVTANLPTSVKGYPIQQPYIVSVPTRFGEISDFSRKLVTDLTTNRRLEYFTLSSMLITPIENGIHTIPVYISLTECGETVYKNWWDIKPEMEKVIKRTLGHTYMPGKVPLNTMMITESPKYTLVPLNGKEYQDINVSFYVPDDFELTQVTFQFSPSPIFTYTKPIPMTGICTSDPIIVNYFVVYPAIVSVRDPLTGNLFRFANQVYIYNNAPGAWAQGVSGYEPDIQAKICRNPMCSINLLVKDKDGPIPYAGVSFMGCGLGRTDINGVLETTAPCGLGPLEIYKERYKIFSEMKSSSEIADIIVELVKKPLINLHFYEVNVRNMSLTEEYMINADDINYLDNIVDEKVHLTFYPVPADYCESDLPYCERIFDSISGTIREIPAGRYSISGSLMNSEWSKVFGAFTTTFNIGEELDGKDLHIYLPYTYGFNQIQDDETKLVAIKQLTSLLEKCGIGPITETPVNLETFGGCTKAYDEL